MDGTKKEGLIVNIRTRVWHSNKQRRGQKQTLSKNVLALYDKNRKVGEGEGHVPVLKYIIKKKRKLQLLNPAARTQSE